MNELVSGCVANDEAVGDVAAVVAEQEASLGEFVNDGPAEGDVYLTGVHVVVVVAAAPRGG